MPEKYSNEYLMFYLLIFNITLSTMSLNTQFFTATCGGTYFDKSSVTLYSPKYPYSYPTDLSCTWRIVGSNMDTQLTFNVSELLLGEESDNCSNDDYIEIDNINPLFNSGEKGECITEFLYLRFFMSLSVD